MSRPSLMRGVRFSHCGQTYVPFCTGAEVSVVFVVHDVQEKLFWLAFSVAAIGMAGIPPALGLLRLATSPAESGHTDLSGANALGGYLLEVGGGNALVCSILFAFGSTLFCWLFLRARTIPAPLAWLGVGASLLLVVVLPAQLGGVVSGPATGYAWMPMLLFELGFALWLLVKGGDARAATAGPGGATSRR